MTNTVLLKRSSTANAVPQAGDLQAGELAINYNDGNLFYKNTSNAVTVIASNKFLSVSGNVTGGNILTTGIVSAGGTVNFISSGNISLGNIGNVHITGGSLGQVISTDGSGNLSWITSPTSSITVDNFTGNGVQTQFTLSVTPTGIDNTTVNYNGVIQLRTDYTLSGANIVFPSPPANGSEIEVTVISASITTPVAGSNTEVQFNDSNVLGGSPTFTFNKTTNTLSVTNYTGTTVSATGNVTGGNILAAGIVSATANITGGNLLTAGAVSATGNVTGNYFIGDGSQLTGITSSGNAISNGTSNVAIGTANGNVDIAVNGIANTAQVGQASLYVQGPISTPKSLSVHSIMQDNVNGVMISPVTIELTGNVYVPTGSTLTIFAPS